MSNALAQMNEPIQPKITAMDILEMDYRILKMVTHCYTFSIFNNGLDVKLNDPVCHLSPLSDDMADDVFDVHTLQYKLC